MTINRRRAKFAAILAVLTMMTSGGNRVYAAEIYMPETTGAEAVERAQEAQDVFSGDASINRQTSPAATVEAPENQSPVTPAEETAGPQAETVPETYPQSPGEAEDIPASTESPEVDFSSEEQGKLPGITDGNPEHTVGPPEKENSGVSGPSGSPEISGKPQQEISGIQSGALYISREKLKKGIMANSDFSITILLKNTWKTGKIQNGKLNLELPEGLYLHPSYEKETFDFPDIQAGAQRKLRIKIRSGEMKEDGRTLRLKVKTLFHHEPEEKESGQQEILLLPVNAAGGKSGFVDNTASYSGGDGEYGGSYGGADSSPEEKKKADPMVPRVIVSQYDYDKNAVSGKTFSTNITICNTSEKLNVENMVLSMETGENASLQGTSNMVYVKSLKPQETYRTELKLKTLEDGKTDSADVTLNFKYEYLKNDERTEVESAQKISVPVQIPDRFSAGELQTMDEPVAGEEFTVSLPYVNKGKIPVSNVEAVIKTEMKAGETYKYLGNVEAGTSGTLDFFVTPEEAGNQKVQITLTYENSAGQEKTVEKEKVFQIAEAEISPEEEMFSEGYMTEAEEQGYTKEGNKAKTGLFAAGGAGTLLAAGAGITRIRRRKRDTENEDF